MRLWLPLLPPWVVGLWVLVTSDEVWKAESLGRNVHGESGTAAWMLLGALVVGTALYAAAPVLGRSLAVSSESSMLAGFGESNALQRSFGAWVVRAFALLGAYVVVASMAVA